MKTESCERSIQLAEDIFIMSSVRLIVVALLARTSSAAFFGALLEPTGPISLTKQNFAAPTHPNLRILNEDPPVYEIPGFLSEEECSSIIAAAESGDELPPIPYGSKNRIFTGRKWAVGSPGAKFLCPAAAPFFTKACAVFGDVPSNRFEPVTVTRYRESEYQAQHLDARLPHEIKRDAAYLRSGGQRIAQLIVYLQPPKRGGETKFFRSAFKNLAVTPETGKALIFPTATLRGEADERYLHSGEPVLDGTKFIIGTWLMETERSDMDDVSKAIDESACLRPPCLSPIPTYSLPSTFHPHVSCLCTPPHPSSRSVEARRCPPRTRKCRRQEAASIIIKEQEDEEAKEVRAIHDSEATL